MTRLTSPLSIMSPMLGRCSFILRTKVAGMPLALSMCTVPLVPTILKPIWLSSLATGMRARFSRSHTEMKTVPSLGSE